MSKRGAYTVRIKRSAEKDMDRLPEKMFRRISEAILRLESDPRIRSYRRHAEPAIMC